MQEKTTLRVEMVIRGQYLVEGLLGRSSSGATYLVRDQRARDVPGNLFVLKEVVEPNKQARHRLVSAGKFLRRLHHPGLPRVHRVLNDDKNKRVYVLVDYIAGQDLETLRQQQPEKLFSLTKVMHIMAPIIAAVTYLHQQQPPIIHDDIKPTNIILPKEDSGFVLVDFGMMKARDPGSTTASSRNCCKAPEQYNGSIDVQTDIYALGATFYTLVTGKLPPDAQSRLTQVGNEAMDPLEPVNSVVPAIPRSISKAIERAMSLNAQNRFSSVEQFWEALWLVLAEQPAPVFDKQSVPQGPPTVPTPGPERAIGQTIEKPVREPLPVVPVLENIEELKDLDVVPVPESIEEPEDLDIEPPLPVVPASTREQEEPDVVPVPESIEEREDIDNEQSPPVVPVLESPEELKELDTVPVSESIEEQEHLDAEQPPVVPVPESIEEQVDQDLEQPPVVPVLESIKEREDLDAENLPVVHIATTIVEPEDLDAQKPPVMPMLDSVAEQEHQDAEKPPPVVPVPKSIAKPEDPDATVRLPRLSSVVREPESLEELEDPDATVRLPKLPPVVRLPHSSEEPEDLDAAKLPSVAPAGVKVQKGLNVVNLLPKPSGDVRTPLSLRKLGILFIVLALLISLGIGASFLSRARSHPAAHSATPASHATSAASRPTSASVASSYSTLARVYTGTIYDISANVTTKMSLTGIQQTQITIGGNFTGLNRTGTFNGIIDPHPPTYIQFTVKDSAGHLILSFDGHMQSDGELSGSYCSVNQDAQCTGDYGLWSVAPAS